MSALAQADVETRTRVWELRDADGVLVVPSTITFRARPDRGDGDDDPAAVEWTVGAGVVSNGDGTGTWTVTAGDLGVDVWRWYALASLSDGDAEVPTGLSGSLTITRP